MASSVVGSCEEGPLSDYLRPTGSAWCGHLSLYLHCDGELCEIVGEVRCGTHTTIRRPFYSTRRPTSVIKSRNWIQALHRFPARIIGNMGSILNARLIRRRVSFVIALVRGCWCTCLSFGYPTRDSPYLLFIFTSLFSRLFSTGTSSLRSKIRVRFSLFSSSERLFTTRQWPAASCVISARFLIPCALSPRS